MYSKLGTSWRNSATLIVLSRRAGEASRRGDVNYDILLQTRTSSASFPNSVVFPGGLTEPADAADTWLKLIQSFGYSHSDFKTLHQPGSVVTPIFQDNPVQRHISLRITAIRETFEELGLLLCSRNHKKDRKTDFASILTDVDIEHWQKRVLKNPNEFITLCEEHKCYPDIWSLFYWSNWLGPSRLPKRATAAFFVTVLENPSTNLRISSEVVKVQWSNPFEVLQNPDIIIYPPQVYELNRLSHVKDIEELLTFAKERSSHGQELLFPVFIKAKDGTIHLLPGDDLYPSVVDYNDKTVKVIDKTIKELRESSHTVHRFEQHSKQLATFVLRNYKPTKHIDMGDITMPARVTIH